MAPKRFLVLGSAFGILWLALIGRVFQVQVLEADHYRSLAEGQSLRRDVLIPRRGEIFDREGRRLVVNVESAPGGPASGSSKEFRWSRLSPGGSLAGQVFGVVGRDGAGQAGLEYQFDRILRGSDGWRVVRYDSRNRYAPSSSDRVEKPVDGVGMRLTLDARIQEIAEHALERGVRRTASRQGVAIVVEPVTGDILAMANYPFFDPNTRERNKSENWKNHAVAKIFEPGSTFKVITAAALLEEKRMAPADTVDAENGTYKIAGVVINDTHPLRRISFSEALAHSSNIAFAKIVMRLKPSEFYKYIRSFGFGMKTGTSLPSEESGWLKSVGEWSSRSQPTLAFGHEIAVTPLQVAMAFAAVANGGTLMRPRLVLGWVDAEGRMEHEEPVHAVRRVISEATASTLREMMKGVVEYGTAADIRDPEIDIAGKTGTAEKIDEVTGKYLSGKFNSSFVGMAPAARPAFVCLVLLDEPGQLKYGGQSAAPIFREIMDRAGALGVGPFRDRTVWGKETKVDSLSAPGMELSSFRRPGHSLPVPVSAEVVRGTSETVMPDVRNTGLREALKRLREMGLEVEYTGEGRILDQQPPSGSPVRHGQHCQLTLGWMG